ncbi:MAG: DUF1631 family protein, partial [Halioglobus sp.]|nr:DUF1631 family protein [Halioglobus sp.]
RDPWYDSAQLVLLKFGSDSEQWQAMCETTELLLDSVQSMENADPERREHIVTVVTRLSKDLRQWLLSLHHDTEAVNEAMARVESVQVSLLRRESVEIGRIQPLPVTDDTSVREQSDLVIALKPVVEWHWFAIDTFSEGSVRMQLVLKDESEQRLLFANMAGMKVADYSFAQFDQLMMKKRVTALPHGGGFSLCLAVAAGVDSTEKLDALYAELALQSAGADDVSDLDDILQYQEDDVPRKESLADVLEKFSRGEYDAAAANGSPTNGGGAAAATGAGQRGELLSDEEMRGLESLIAEGEPTAPRPRRIDPVEEDNSASNDDMSLPMGIWVGFHDGDQPTQGKLAVHDAASDTYIFVDRQGGKLREIPGYQLSALMNHGLVVIMQANPVADAE